MAEFDEKLLKQHIKKGEFASVYLICGNEDYLKKHYCDTIVSKNVNKDFESLNYEKHQGKDADLQQIFEAAAIMPMMSDKRCILIEDFKLESINDKELSLIEEYFENPCDTSVIIFLQKRTDFSLVKAKKAVDLIKKHGVVCVLDKRTGSDLIKPLVSSASKNKCILSNDVAKYLVSVVGDDFNVLVNELSKVCNYVGEGEITRKHIDAVAIKSDDTKIHFLTRALFAKDFDKAFEVLHSLLKQKIEPEYILGTIISSYVDIYRAKISVANGEGAESLAQAYNYKNMAFRLSNAARDGSKLDISVVRKCLEELSKTDDQLKFGAANPTLVLEQLIVRLFLIINGERV